MQDNGPVRPHLVRLVEKFDCFAVAHCRLLVLLLFEVLVALRFEFIHGSDVQLPRLRESDWQILMSGALQVGPRPQGL